MSWRGCDPIKVTQILAVGWNENPACLTTHPEKWFMSSARTLRWLPKLPTAKHKENVLPQYSRLITPKGTNWLSLRDSTTSTAPGSMGIWKLMCKACHIALWLHKGIQLGGTPIWCWVIKTFKIFPFDLHKNILWESNRSSNKDHNPPKDCHKFEKYQ